MQIDLKTKKPEKPVLNQKLVFVLFFCFVFFDGLKSQVSFLSEYQIKNNSNLSVAVDFTVSCNKGKETNEAKLIFIPAGETYKVPAPFFNSARFSTDCDIIIKIAGLFGSEAVSFSHQTSRYNDDMGFFNSDMYRNQNNLKPQGVIIWGPMVTNIW